MEWWVWISRWFLFSVRYSRLYRIYHEKHKTLPINPLIYVYINRIYRLVFKTKDGYTIELQTPERKKLFSSTKKLIDKTKNRENVTSLEVAEVVLVQRNLVDDKYQQKFKVLYTFTSNKSYVYLLIEEPRNLVFLKVYNTEYAEIIITFTDQMVEH